MDKKGKLFVDYCVEHKLDYAGIIQHYVDSFVSEEVATERNLVANAIKYYLQKENSYD